MQDHGGMKMQGEKDFDSLIDAAWSQLLNGFDAAQFLHWQADAMNYLTGLYGSDHHYTKSFRAQTRSADEVSLLVAGGILSAAREQLLKKSKT
jgi:hypothetical protein